MKYPIRLSVVQRLALALALTALLCLLVVWIALRQPWLGLGLEADAPSNAIVVRSVEPQGPAAGAVRAGERLLSVAGSGAIVRLQALDLVEEPDSVESYDVYNSVLDRQHAIHAILTGGDVTLTLADPAGAERAVDVVPHDGRPLATLPGIFWFQLGCALVIMVIAHWVTTLRPDNRDAAYFAYAGYGAALAIFCASIYSTRELALDGVLFRALSFLNHTGSIGFAIFMIGLFTIYPIRLGLERFFRASTAVLVLWLGVNALQLFPNNLLGFYLGILLAMIAITVLIVMQYRATRGDARSRKALLWLGMSVLIGAGAFSILMAVPILLNQPGVLSQAHSFGFFPLIYLGVALGLTRYRLFELDRWAFDALTYLFAAVLFLAVDILLVTVLAVNLSVSLAVTAIVIGLVYLPVRNLVASRVTGGREEDPFDLFQASAEIALQPTPDLRAERWRHTLARYFSPLHVETAPHAPASPQVRDDGAVLALPAFPWSPPLELHHNKGGTRLFGPPHAKAVERLAFLVSEAEQSRRAYDMGVTEERRRIGRDLHDNVGAMLISSLTARDGSQSRDLVRSALGDIREIVNGLSDRRQPLSAVVAELRAETFERAGQAAIEWPAGPADEAGFALPYPLYRAFTSAHREMLGNALRHSTAIRVGTGIEGAFLVHRIENGLAAGAAPSAGIGGHGLKNLEQRAAELGGSFAFEAGARSARAEIRLPLDALGQP